MAKVQKSKSVWGEIGIAALSAAVGGALGVLFAPKTGKQVRKELATTGKKTIKTVRKAVKK